MYIMGFRIIIIMKVIIRTYISANKLNAIRTYEWKNSVYMVITMSMSMTYVQLIQLASSTSNSQP